MAADRDVVIVGGGAIGVCVAYELTRAGARATLLERNAAVGTGCSLGNAGMFRVDHMHPLATPGAVREGLQYMSCIPSNGPFINTVGFKVASAPPGS